VSAKKTFRAFLDLFEEDRPGEIAYDPAHVAAVLVSCLAALGFLYWLLWALLVCEGGLPSKVVPFFQVLLTSRTLQDFGYRGHPYELGIFEGWIVNVGALAAGAGLLAGLRRIFTAGRPGARPAAASRRTSP
jgi:hypothetical protein